MTRRDSLLATGHPRRPHRPRTEREVGPRGLPVAATALLLLLFSASPSRAADASHPLEPPDTFSPRGTIDTLERSLGEAWTLFAARDPSFGQPLRRAVNCLDMGDFPPEVAEELGVERPLLLKEVLDRFERPPLGEIPGPAEVEERELRQWTLPHTEIALTRIEEGERAGEFVFSSRTVERLPEFYEKVRSLPYQPGREGAHYDAIRSGALLAHHRTVGGAPPGLGPARDRQPPAVAVGGRGALPAPRDRTRRGCFPCRTALEGGGAAVPVQVELEGHDAPLDEDRRRQVAETTRQWREDGRLGVTEYPPRSGGGDEGR